MVIQFYGLEEFQRFTQENKELELLSLNVTPFSYNTSLNRTKTDCEIKARYRYIDEGDALIND